MKVANEARLSTKPNTSSPQVFTVVEFCRYYKKKKHTKDKCFKLQLKKQKDHKGTSDVAYIVQTDGYIFFAYTSKKLTKGWIIDSGTKYHRTVSYNYPPLTN